MRSKSLARHIQAAIKHFEIEPKEVTEKHIKFMQDQERAESNRYNNEVLGREYSVDENGVVDFTKPLLTNVEQETIALFH